MSKNIKPRSAICYSFIYGPKNATVPTGNGNRPAMFSSAPFFTDSMTPIEAMSAAAYHWHKIQPHPSHWRIVHTHTLRTDAATIVNKSKLASKPSYSTVCVLEYLPERAMRAHRGVDDDELHGFLKSSWYVQQETESSE
jgi:hypothetical protein